MHIGAIDRQTRCTLRRNADTGLACAANALFFLAQALRPDQCAHPDGRAKDCGRAQRVRDLGVAAQVKLPMIPPRAGEPVEWTDDEVRALHSYAQAIVAGRTIVKIIVQFFAAVGIVAGACYSALYAWDNLIRHLRGG